jgi:hypothetical protein
MNLEELLNEPKLIEITAERDSIVKKYGSAPNFYIYDRQDMETYMQLAKFTGNESDINELTNIVKKLVRNSKGDLILGGKKQLPPDVMMVVVEETISKLGNLVAQTSETPAES